MIVLCLGRFSRNADKAQKSKKPHELASEFLKSSAIGKRRCAS